LSGVRPRTHALLFAFVLAAGAYIWLAIGPPWAGLRRKPAAHLLDGPEITYESLRGAPVALDFFQTWCQPCRRTLHAWARRYDGRVRFFAAGFDEPDGKVRALRDELGLQTAIIAGAGRWAADLGIRGVPTLVVLDADGRVAASITDPEDSTVFPVLDRVAAGR
jgi:thiol-disulfide isomerase/thioredoxin